MSEEDRELLRLAAKAIGGMYDECGAISMDSGIDYNQWEPLEDDGDALRLAVGLMITVKQSPFGVDACVLAGSATFEGWGDDRAAATRRAIVRAAAEIGKATA